MAPYSEDALPDSALEKVYDYLDTFPQPTDGPGLFADDCANCHGADGNGGVVGVSVYGELFELFEKVREGENTGNPGARNSYMPAEPASVLTDAEVQLIYDFLAGA